MLLKKKFKSILDIRKFEYECLDCLCCKYNGTCDTTKIFGSEKTLNYFCMLVREYGRYYFIGNKLKTKYLVMK